MELRYAREAIVGTMVILAIVIFVAGTMWLSGRVLGPKHVIRVEFRDVSGLKRASPVVISGVQVGRVERIELAGVGRVIVSISIPPQIVPKIDAAAEIAPVGLVGDYIVEFNPGRAAEPLPKDRIVIGRLKSGFSDRARTLGDRADSLMIGLQYFANKETAEDLRGTLKALQGALVAFQKTMQQVSDPQRGPTAEAARTMVSLQKLSARLDSTLANPALQSTLRNTDTLTGNLAGMTRQLTYASARLDTLLTGVNAGRGTVGKFVTDSGLYQDMRELSASMKALITELQKNPGKLGVTVKVF